jgi:hypothetical protein
MDLFDLAKPPAAAPRGRRDLNLEARLQAAIVGWIRTSAPGVFVFHPASGGWRARSSAARFRWLGLVPGVPDLVVVAPQGRVPPASRATKRSPRRPDAKSGTFRPLGLSRLRRAAPYSDCKPADRISVVTAFR